MMSASTLPVSTTQIRVCAGTACHASGRTAIREAIDETLLARGLTHQVSAVETGCHGFCEQGPIAVLDPEGILIRNFGPRTSRRSSRRALFPMGSLSEFCTVIPAPASPSPVSAIFRSIRFSGVWFWG